MSSDTAARAAPVACARRSREECPQRLELAARHRQARRHGMAAALDEVARRHGRPHRRADIDAVDRAQRARALALPRPRR